MQRSRIQNVLYVCSICSLYILRENWNCEEIKISVKTFKHKTQLKYVVHESWGPPGSVSVPHPQSSGSIPPSLHAPFGENTQFEGLTHLCEPGTDGTPLRGGVQVRPREGAGYCANLCQDLALCKEP